VVPLLTEVDVHAILKLLGGAFDDAVSAGVGLAARVRGARQRHALDALLVVLACTNNG